MAVTTERVTVTDAATQLAAPPAGGPHYRTTVTVRNRGGNSVDLGDATVASGGGFELAPGDEIALPLAEGEELYAVAAATLTSRVDVIRHG